MRKNEQRRVDACFKELFGWLFQAIGTGQRDKANKHAKKIFKDWGCKQSTKGTWWKRDEVLRCLLKIEQSSGPSVYLKIFTDYISLHAVALFDRLQALDVEVEEDNWVEHWLESPELDKPTYFLERYKAWEGQPIDQQTLVIDVLMMLAFPYFELVAPCLLAQIHALNEENNPTLVWDEAWLEHVHKVMAEVEEHARQHALEDQEDEMDEGEEDETEMGTSEAPLDSEAQASEGVAAEDVVASEDIEPRLQTQPIVEAPEANEATDAMDVEEVEPLIDTVDAVEAIDTPVVETVSEARSEPTTETFAPTAPLIGDEPKFDVKPETVSPFKSDDRRQVMVRNYFESERHLTVPNLESGLGRYLGYVRKNSGNFQNFYFVADWAKDRFGEIEVSLAKQRFPKWGAVNLAIEQRKGPKEGGFFVMDVEDAEWEFNLDENHEPRQDYVYRVDYNRLVSEKRFRPAHEFGIYPVVRPAPTADLPLDLTRSVYVVFTDRASDEVHVELSGEYVLLEANGLLYGPVKVKETAKKQSYVQFADQAGVVQGFKIDRRYYHSVAQFVRGNDTQANTYVSMQCVDTQFMTPIDIDIWSDAELVKRLSAAQSIKDVDTLVETIEAGDAFFSSNREISLARQQRLKNMILRVDERAETRLAFADFLYREVMQRKDQSLAALVRCIANDNELIEVLAQNATIGREIDDLKAQHKTLKDQVNQRRQDVKNAQQEVQRHERQVSDLQKAISAKTKDLGLFDENSDVVEAFKALELRLSAKREEYERLKGLEDTVVDRINEAMANASTEANDCLPNDVTEAVKCWNETKETRHLTDTANATNEATYQGPTGQKLANALVRYVQSKRAYGDNTVLNLYLSMVQNFLTVLSGAPGVGKTSICGIIADSLGMNTFNDTLPESLQNRMSANRFLCVPVEYGWTTKRDFIGYWNPLTSRFESPDPDRWQLIRRLDIEARSEKGSVYPAMMLLDEANLSPMEYYWSDWMRLCDEEDFPGEVRLWDKATTKVPETLRFMATINNDNTTEGLSPRLIDRVGVITLPDNEDDVPMVKADSVSVVRAPWAELKAVFGACDIKDNGNEIHRVIQEVYCAFDKVGIRFSPRARGQIKGYVGAASNVFKAKNAKPAYLEAIDFAVMQKGLPRVNGTGANYRAKLKELLTVFDRLSLDRSAKLLGHIIEEGDEALNCYRFF